MRTRAISILMAGTALAMSGQAFAQDTVPQDAADEAADSSIVVTGTRIVRDGYTAPTPVTVATMEELVKSTPTNIPDALNKLPQFQNSLSPGKSANNFSNFPIHGNVLNLRGLGTPTNNPKGPLRTLIMMDGIRVAPTTFIGTIDTNVIPNLLVSRVDVVTGGASAAWGSDAVAGVVNFVLDRKFTGIKGVAQAGTSQRGNNGNQRLGLAWGADFAGDRGHVLLSAEYYNNEGMRRKDRGIGRAGYAYVGSTVGCTVPAGQPATLCTPGGALNPLTIGRDVRIAVRPLDSASYTCSAAGWNASSAWASVSSSSSARVKRNGVAGSSTRATARKVAASFASQVGVSKPGLSGTRPSRGSSPCVVRRPQMPQ